MKKNILFEFVYKHKKIERIIELRSSKYRKYVINKAMNCITKDLKNPKQSLKEK